MTDEVPHLLWNPARALAAIMRIGQDGVSAGISREWHPFMLLLVFLASTNTMEDGSSIFFK